MLIDFIKLRENLVFNNRIIIGLFIFLLIFVIFFFNLNYFFLFLLFIFVSFELYKIKIIEFNKYFFFLALLSFIFFLLFQYFEQVYIIPIVILLTIATIINKEFIKTIFPFLILLFFYILFLILNIEKNLFYLIFFISFFNDTLDYFFGRLIKGPLIISKISPNKTWSGTTIFFIIYFFCFFFYIFNLFESFLLSLSLFFGDVYFSYIKRYLNLKDFSNLLQSHGGFLDRLDSMYLFSIILFFFLST